MEKFEITEFLRDYDRDTKRGICISCGKIVSWAREKVAAHKRKNCSADSAFDNKFQKTNEWYGGDYSKEERRSSSKVETFQITDYLRDLNKSTRRGVCISCGKEVGWAREKIAAHKRRNCPNVMADGNDLLWDKPASGDSDFDIKQFLHKLNTKTSRGNCIACEKEVGWAKRKVASHKRLHCVKASEEEKSFFRKRKARDDEMTSDESSDEESASNSFVIREADNFMISKYLHEFDKETRRGVCISCGKGVGWAKERVAAHKRKSCTNATAEEKRFFAKRKTTFKWKSETGDMETFRITEYLEDFDKTTGRGRCIACGMSLQWSRSRVASHKRTHCISGLSESKVFAEDETADGDSNWPSFESAERSTRVRKAKKSFAEVDIKQQKDSSDDDFNFKVPDDPVNCFICSEAFGQRRPVQLTNILSSTRTPLYKTLESFIDVELSVETANGSAVCKECFLNLEKYDCFQKKSRDIQKKVTAAYFKTSHEPVFIKQEPAIAERETILVTSFDDTNSFEDQATFKESPEPSEASEDEAFFATTAPKPKTTVDRKVYQCFKCKKRCQSQLATSLHLVIEHRLEKDSFECPICFKVMADKSVVRNHFVKHRRKEFLCMHCGKVLADERYFKRHLMMHDDARPCKCTFEGCGKSFRTASNLRIHSRVHTGEKMYECPFCPGKRFAQSWGRQLHIKSQHGGQSSKSTEECQICGLQFDCKSKLRAHLSKTHEVVYE